MNVYTCNVGYFSGSVFQETSERNLLDCKRIYGRLYYTHCNMKICNKKFELDFTERGKNQLDEDSSDLDLFESPSSTLLLHSYTVHAINISLVVKIS